jgi:murein DD-endopeptidase MepM/ murein hydrolase activator NlpD
MSFNQNSVIIKHGEYFTVYSNLKTVNVKINSKVSTKQVIGTAYTNPSDGITSTHLEIWKGRTKIDPALWIRAQ